MFGFFFCNVVQLYQMSKPSKDGENTETNKEGKTILRDDKGKILAGSAPLNPDGKLPGTKHMSTKLLNALERLATNKDGSQSEKTYSDLLTERIIKDAIEKGNTSLINLIYSYIDGAPQQGLDLTSGGEKITASSEEVMKIAAEVSKRLKEQKT